LYEWRKEQLAAETAKAQRIGETANLYEWRKEQPLPVKGAKSSRNHKGSSQESSPQRTQRIAIFRILKLEESYIPGTCNIAKDQLVKRKRFAAKCLGLTVWAIALLQIFDLSKWWRLPMVILFTLSALAIQQVYYRFCYVFGLKGLYGLGALGKTQKISDDKNLKKDRAKARRMIISSVVIGVVLTVIYFFLPI